VARHTDDRMEGQKESAQGATAASTSTRVEGVTGRGWRAAYRQSTQPIRDGLHRSRQWYDSLPVAVRAVVIAALIGLAALLPTMLPYITGQAQYWTNILTKIGIGVLLALGLNVVVGFAGLLDLGYVAFFAVGAYSFALLSGAARFAVAVQSASGDAAKLAHALTLKPTWHMYMWLFFFVALGIAMLAGVILGAPTLRLRGDYLAIVTLGFGEIVRITANNLSSIEGGPVGVTNIPHPAIPGYDFGINNPPYYYLLLIIIVIWIFLIGRMNGSRIGRAWAAIREDEVAAASMGVATIRMKLLAFAIGAAVASFGGVIYASQISFINPQTFTLFNPAFGSVIILAMVVLGGMGGIAGPILGAAAIIFLPEYFRSVEDARFFVFGLALVVIMVLRPQGLIPSRRRAAELTGGEIHEGSVFEAQQHGG
jgi:branched-chain amino acid transport system permease protein